MSQKVHSCILDVSGDSEPSGGTALASRWFRNSTPPSLVSVTIWHLLYAKEMMFKGKDGSTSVLHNLTNGLAWANSKDNVGGMRTSGSKGELLTATAGAGAKDTGSDGYRRSDKEGGG